MIHRVKLKFRVENDPERTMQRERESTEGFRGAGKPQMSGERQPEPAPTIAQVLWSYTGMFGQLHFTLLWTSSVSVPVPHVYVARKNESIPNGIRGSCGRASGIVVAPAIVVCGGRVATFLCLRVHYDVFTTTTPLFVELKQSRSRVPGLSALNRTFARPPCNLQDVWVNGKGLMSVSIRMEHESTPGEIPRVRWGYRSNPCNRWTSLNLLRCLRPGEPGRWKPPFRPGSFTEFGWDPPTPPPRRRAFPSAGLRACPFCTLK